VWRVPGRHGTVYATRPWGHSFICVDTHSHAVTSYPYIWLSYITHIELHMCHTYVIELIHMCGYTESCSHILSTHMNELHHTYVTRVISQFPRRVTCDCNTLQHIATHCNTLHHTYVTRVISQFPRRVTCARTARHHIGRTTLRAHTSTSQTHFLQLYMWFRLVHVTYGID